MERDTPSWTEHLDNPYLRGLYAPTIHESEATELPIEGELPRDLYGAYVRNGPNAVLEPPNDYHWFDGDGMVHAVYFRNGVASYRSRQVPTAALAEDLSAQKATWAGVMGPLSSTRGFVPKDTANTDVVWHHGKLLALWYLCGEPYALDPTTLAPMGVDTFANTRTTTVSAHPKVDPRTGELVWFTLSDFEPPHMTYGVCAADGRVTHQVPIDLPGARAPHDITITKRYSILHDFPFFHDPDVVRRHGYRVVRFHRELPTRFGVLPRHGDTHDVRWFEFEPGYVLHMVNAWEEGDWIIMDGCFEPDPTIVRRPGDGELASMLGNLRVRAHMHRWRMNMASGACHEEPLDDLNVEFPLPDTERYGEKTRYSYVQYLPEDMYTAEFRALVKYDHDDGSCTRYDYPDGWYGSEAPFAGRRDTASEDDGYVVTIMTHRDGHSEAWVFLATEIERGPITQVRLPRRVPAGFHAKWIPGPRLWPEENKSR
ncbi:MAG: carotenoid oxygenase family protein [Myxococcota bacterium]